MKPAQKRLWILSVGSGIALLGAAIVGQLLAVPGPEWVIAAIVGGALLLAVLRFFGRNADESVN